MLWADEKGVWSPDRGPDAGAYHAREQDRVSMRILQGLFCFYAKETYTERLCKCWHRTVQSRKGSSQARCTVTDSNTHRKCEANGGKRRSHLGQAQDLLFLYMDACNEAFPPSVPLADRPEQGRGRRWDPHISADPGPDALQSLIQWRNALIRVC